MALYLINGERLLVNFKNDHSSVISYPALPGSRIRSFQNEHANLLLKEIISDLFSIRFKIFRFSKKQKIEYNSGAVGFHSRIMLQNELQLSIGSVGKLHQTQGTVSLLSGPLGTGQATLEAETEYKALDIYISEDLSSQLAFFFPQVEFNADRVRNLIPFPCFISPALQKVIDEICDCSYDERTSYFYFDVKVREYFFLLLQDCTTTKKVRYKFTPYEIDQLCLAREILLSDLTKPPLSINQLSKSAGINEFKLKAGFTRFFKTGVFECFQRARMHKARQLLLQTNKPIKEICTLAGYPRMTNFITAFRKYFGYTPGSLRRN
jgi:AraC-like DNA-binding protein